MKLSGLHHSSYDLSSKYLKDGGEGLIYSVNGNQDILAKIYKPGRISIDLENKIKFMVNHPPEKLLLDSVAWPVDILYNNNSFAGFIMPKLQISKELSVFYEYPPVQPFTLKQKLIVAQNICFVIEKIHQAGYVFGDFNPRNIGVNHLTGKVGFFDTDTYHFKDKSNNIFYRCIVAYDGYIAPELLAKCSKGATYETILLPTFTPWTDLFALSIHIFRLLMNGFSPYNGTRNSGTSSTRAPGVGNQAVIQDNYCFKTGFTQPPAVPPLNSVPSEIADLFTKSFIDGRSNPKKRPTPGEWRQSLNKYESSLTVCKRDSSHMYFKALQKCPWCEANKEFYTQVNQNRPRSSIPSNPFVNTQATTTARPNPIPQVRPSSTTNTLNQSPNVSKKIGLIAVLAVIGLIAVLSLFGFASRLFSSSQIDDTSSANTSYSSNYNNSSTSNTASSSNTTISQDQIQQQVSSCPGAKPQQLVVGEKGTVCTKRDRLIMRSQPSSSGSEIFRMYPGTTVKIIDGPICSDGASWWKIKVPAGTLVHFYYKGYDDTLDQSATGWVREGSDSIDPYYICPVE